jgi:hypothetical protein
MKAPIPLLVTPGSDQIFQTISRDGQLQEMQAIGARLDHLTTVCTQLAENATSRSVVYSSPRVEQKSYDDDRSMNVMVFVLLKTKMREFGDAWSIERCSSWRVVR